jgi:hypothetical protein
MFNDDVKSQAWSILHQTQYGNYRVPHDRDRLCVLLLSVNQRVARGGQQVETPTLYLSGHYRI